MKRLPVTVLLWHEGHPYHLGEDFGHGRVGRKRNRAGQTEIYFANRLLGHLVFDPAERFRPKAYIAPRDRKSRAKPKLKSNPKV